MIVKILKFYLALIISLYFFSKVDILIWQRIFESNKLFAEQLEKSYYIGWLQALYGLMALGFLFLLPDLRLAILFPISLRLLAYSGLEDILYYLLDKRSIPFILPWLNEDKYIILKPVTSENLIISALFWCLTIILLDIITYKISKYFYNYNNKDSKNERNSNNQNRPMLER